MLNPVSPDIKNPLLCSINTDVKFNLQLKTEKKHRNYEPIPVMEISESSINEDILKTGCKTGSAMITEYNSSAKVEKKSVGKETEGINKLLGI
jgi:hypothetical protein